MNQNRILINQISINPSSIARLFGAVAFFLVTASVGGQLITYLTGHDTVFGLIPLFDVNSEQNIPTYFSSFLLIFSSLLLLIIAIIERNRKYVDFSKWAILSLCFLYMAFDEALSFHEKLTIPMRNLMDYDHLGIFYWSWVIPGIAIVILFAIFFLRFFLRLNAKTRLNFLIAATLYIGGAIGLELIGGWYAEIHGQDNLTYNMLTSIEESLEMAGAIVFIWGLLTYMSENFKTVQFHFTGVGEYPQTDIKV